MSIQPMIFQTVDPGAESGGAPLIQPWKVVPLDPSHSGAWVVTGDIDGDGSVEIVSARNVNVGDIHHTSAVVAQDLDGRVLWRWGYPGIGRRGLHHDVACQIHDWDGDGRKEVIVCTDTHLVELDGASGEERRRLPIPPDAADCVTFADLSGRGHASDVLVKTRYGQIWAMNYEGELLWTVSNPAGAMTAHQPFPVDIDGDGRDEIMVGYALLNPDGSTRWILEDLVGPSGGGHLDCCRVLRRGEQPRDWRLVLTCCGFGRLAVIDGEGQSVWNLDGHHFESIDIGRICPDHPGPQILVDIVPPSSDSREYPLWVVSEDGELLGEIMTEYARFHTLVDWGGDGCDKIVSPYSRGLFDGRGERIGTFAMEPQVDIYGGQPVVEGEVGGLVLDGDMTGNGISDVAITAPFALSIFRNPGNGKPTDSPDLGCSTNFTLY